METKSEMQDIVRELKELREQVQAVEYKVNQMTDHPHIVRVEGVHGGQPIVRGKSVTVQTIVVLSKQNISPEQLVEDYDHVLTLAEVYDALSYYHDHQGEIDQYIAENDAARERGWQPPVSS